MISRLATGLKKLPSEVETMTLPQALSLFEYWQEWPPEHELLAIAVSAYTTWKPASGRTVTDDEHRASLERRWAAGAMNPEQMAAVFGASQVIDGAPDLNFPGIGPFPGTIH